MEKDIEIETERYRVGILDIEMNWERFIEIGVRIVRDLEIYLQLSRTDTANK